MPAPNHQFYGRVVRHIERRARPGKEMNTLLKSLLVSVCVCVPMLDVAAGTLDPRDGSKPEPKLLERTERKSPPVDVLAAPSALAQWVNQHSKSRLEVSVRINR